MYTIREASKLLDIKVRTIRTLISEGKLEAKKDEKTKRWKIYKKSLERLARENADKD